VSWKTCNARFATVAASASYIGERLGERLGERTWPLVFGGAAIALLREQFAAGTIRRACAGCSWYELCTTSASAGYAVARL
jgi:uncharacterized protein